MPLKVSHGIGAWIKDFKTSTNPRFKGKSDKERRDQAIAAYLSAKRDQKEEVDKTPPFEGPYKKVKSVIPGKHGEGPSTAKHLAKMGMKAVQDKKKPVKEASSAYSAVTNPLKWAADKEKAKKQSTLTHSDRNKLGQLAQMLAKEKKPTSEGLKSVKEVSTNTLTSYLRKASPTVDAAKERLPGIKKALHKLDQKIKKEETVNELDKSTLQSYKDKTKAQIGTLKKVAKTMDDPAHKAPWERGIGVRSKGLERAKKRLGEDINESEQLDELSPGLLGRYTRARGSLNITKKQSKMKARAHQKMRDKTKDLSAIAGKYSNPADLTHVEATTFEVDIEGLPKMYIKDKSPGAVKAKLRGIVKQPSMIQGVDRVTDAAMKKTYRDKAQGRDEEEMDEGTSSLKPGWMLKADPKLGAAVKAKQDLAKKRQATYGKPEAGKSVKEKVNEISGELAQRYHDKAVKAPAPKDKKDPLKHTIKRFASMQKAQDIIHKSELKRIGGQK